MYENLKHIVDTLPELSGVYQYLNQKEEIIYVGKAKNLRKRVSSYFSKSLTSKKTAVLLKNISNIVYTVVDSEEEALLLENNLIKQHQPRYNILLKDDKSFPYICIKNEPFPRIFKTRNVIKDGSEYYGPFTHMNTLKTLLDICKYQYTIRTCHLHLTKESILAHKFKVCLEYHIKNCKGPCVNKQTENDYLQQVNEVRSIIKGNIKEVCSSILEEINVLANELRFEEAHILKQKLQILENYQSKWTVVNPNITHVDVFSIQENADESFVNYMNVVNGCIVQAYTVTYKKQLDETKETILGLAIIEMRERFNSKTNEIIVPFVPDGKIKNAEFTVPLRGDKKKLLELSIKNALQYKVDRLKQAEKLNPEQRTTRIVKQLQQDLHLNSLPLHIECFDNSNTQGTNPVSACVVFKSAKPSKKDYRHYHIKTVEGPDDFKSMQEVVSRRYSRLLEENQPLPQLIIVDGGKGQLSSVYEILKKLDLDTKIAVIGIAKRLEEIFFPNDPIPLYLDKKSETLKVIQHLRDEAHRFGITFHRKIRSKKQTVSSLDSIEGIGEQTKMILLKTFKSVKRIKETPIEELEKIVGKAKAKKIADFYKNSTN